MWRDESGWTRAWTGIGLPLAGLVLLLALHPRAARAQGWGIYEQGACVMARGGASVAEDCGDGSSLFFNPAALTGIESFTLTGGGMGVFPAGGFRADQGAKTELETERVLVPHLYAAFPMGDRFVGGLGAYAPYGLETAWPVTFDGRFIGYDNVLQTLYLQPTLALRITDWLSVGGGPSLVLSSVRLNRRLDLAAQPMPAELGGPAGATFGDLGIPDGTDFADLTVNADEAVAGSGNVGLLLEPHPRVSVGVRYLLGTTVEYQGFAAFEPVATGLTLPAENSLGLPAGTSVDSLLEAGGIFLTGGPLTGQEVFTALELPAQLVAGVAVTPVEDLRVLVDWQWTRWSEMDVIEVDFQAEATPDDEIFLGYEDTHGLRLGAEYGLLPDLALRAGFIWNQEAAPPESVTPLLPEGPRTHLTAGLGWRVTESLALDLAYQRLSQDDRRGRVDAPRPGVRPTTALNGGVYTFDADLLSGTVSYRFR